MAAEKNAIEEQMNGFKSMSSWIIKCAERYLSLLYDRLIIYLLTHKVVHADETPMLVTKDGRKAGAKSYMWVYRSWDGIFQ